MSDTSGEEYITESNEHYYLSVLPQDIKEELRRRHGVKGRYYHTWEHVKELFNLLEQVDESIECLPALILAIVFHDSVYDTRRVSENERRSAALMRKLCKGMDAYWVERADTLIMATVDHKLPPEWTEDLDAAYFLDMDMAVLGSAPERYREYAAQIRDEYARYDNAQYAAGRISALRQMLAQLDAGELYHTAWGRASFQAQAANNMQWELNQLEKADD